jgi:ubiquinol-cytochrome c reductase iron-sulfur subunit
VPSKATGGVDTTTTTTPASTTTPVSTTTTIYTGSATAAPPTLTAIAGIGVPRQVRWAHTDVRYPDFSEVRTAATRDPHETSIEADRERRFFSYAIAATAGTATVVAGKQIVTSIVQFLLPPKDVVAAAKIEVDLTQIPEGRQITVKWGGKPLFVRHRTAAEISTEQNTVLSTLKDPALDADRVKDPRWLVVIGICTHLGCVPLPHLGDYNGYYCPCHGSHYDASGRIRRGPAPGNLPVPDYEFISADRILVG